MIIQLVTFSEEKARQFIYQEDQKTKMKRIDSAAMNQYNPANTVVTKLNSDPNSNIRGMVVKNNGKIDPSLLSALISSYLFDNTRKATVKETLDVTNNLEEKFNQLTSENTEWLDHEFTQKELQVIMFCFVNGCSDNETIAKMIELSDTIDSNNYHLNKNMRVKRKLVNELTSRLDQIKGGG